MKENNAAPPIRSAMQRWSVAKPTFSCAPPSPDAGFETICTHYGDEPGRHFGTAVPPIYQTSTFIYPDAEAFEKRRTAECPHYDYTRAGNPTNQILEAKLALLEKGQWADCFASGMGAITAAINSSVQAGAHVVAVAFCYGPTQWYLRHLQRFGVETTFVRGADPQGFITAIRPNTKLIYLESPASGRFEVPEIEPITKVARERGITTIFDNSWATPYFQNPLQMGADLVVHSASKYLNGHTDVVAGCVIGREHKLREPIWDEVELAGAPLDPFAAWLTLRGLRTLALRMERHQENGLAVARFLERHPKIAFVLHPGLESHPQHAIAARQLRGYASLFSFALREQGREAMHRFLDRLRLFGLGVSWGGFDSLILGGTLFSADPDRPEWLIRVHVGLETKEDLIADLKQALED
jgi:cystathionine beta-lyase